jgi:hypothetical protein
VHFQRDESLGIALPGRQRWRWIILVIVKMKMQKAFTMRAPNGVEEVWFARQHACRDLALLRRLA